jgi:hypothetical protein
VSTKRGIPLHPSQDANENVFRAAVKAALDKILGKGRNAAPLAKLPEGATAPEIIKAINQLIDRLS